MTDMADAALENQTRLEPIRVGGGRWRRRIGLIGAAIIGIVVLTALIGPILQGVDPNTQSITNTFLRPWSWNSDGTVFHILGTDDLGRDTLARLMAGGRASLAVVAMGVVFGCVLGMAVGMTAGFYGGRVDVVLMRVVDAQLAIPLLISALLVTTILGVGFVNTSVALGVASWAIYARLIRAETLKLREEAFFESTIALGAGKWRLTMRHLAPNLASTLLVVASLEMGGLVVTESSLSYLGLGMQPPDASWGSMIRQGQRYIFTAWWLAAIPGTAIMLTVLGFNLMGDWLRDVLDPQVD